MSRLTGTTAAHVLLIRSLLDAAFRELQHDTGSQNPEYVIQRATLEKEFRKILRRGQRAAKCSN